MESEKLSSIDNFNEESPGLKRRFADQIGNRWIMDRHRPLYLSYFEITMDDLRDKRILDIGAGIALFAKKLQQEGIEVVSVDPLYGLKAGREAFKRNASFNQVLSGYNKRKAMKKLPGAVAAEIDAHHGEGPVHLPFKDESFDVIFAVYSAFMYAKSEEDIDMHIDEAMRILKKEGKLYIYPFSERHFWEKTVLDGPNYPVSNAFNKEFFSRIERMEKEGLISIEIGKPRNDEKIQNMKSANLDYRRYMVIKKLRDDAKLSI